MKKIKVIAILLLCMILLVPTFARAEDSEVPYQTYTYDRWSNPTPTPNAYLPTRSIGGAQLGCGNFNGAQDLFYSEARHELYVVDSGNARVLVLDEDFRLLREITGFNGDEAFVFSNPQGVFVQDDGRIYLCDMGRQQVAEADADGNLIRVLPTPSSPLLPENFNYLPTKVVVDGNDRIYILSRGVYQGLIYLEPDGTFIKFFGANEVEMTLGRQVQKLWKSILSDQAAASMQSFNPIEYSNLFLNDEGYIFATAAGSENGARVLTQLNPLGINVLNWTGGSETLLYSDVVERDGIIVLLDTNGGYLIQTTVQRDAGLSMQITFGGIGQQLGLFQKPVSLAEIDGNLYVLDAEKNTITEFVLTDFGREIHEAIALYNQGLYIESIVPWEKVIRHNSNYLPGYTGLGKAYYQMHDYKTAMYYFRLAGDRENYSLAFKEHSLGVMRDAFPYIATALIVLVVGGLILGRILKKRKEARHAER
ncbi:MAG: hypothetical protein IKI52_05775 [Clostridia bacterium]|nr:hypothetical protein [Clostridia bacterium]